MCLAILMYLVTGTLALLWQVAMTVGIFLMTLLGKAILFVCASIYTVARPIAQPPGEDVSLQQQPSVSDSTAEQPFITMYPEIGNFDEDYDTMARVSLETVTSSDNSPRHTGRRRLTGTSSGVQYSSTDRARHDQHRRVGGKRERTVDGQTEAKLQRGSRQPRQHSK